MKKEFSFNYGDKQFVFSAENNAVYELEKGVTVQVVCKEYKEYDAVEWVLYFENKSDSNSQIISNICDCDTVFPLTYPRQAKSGYKPVEGDACVITMNGMVEGRFYWENDKVSATEYNFNYEYLCKTPKKQFGNIGGRSSEGMMPFFDVTANGEGYIAAIGWTGDWKAEFSKASDGIRMKSGLKETNFYLKAGEKIRTSSTLIMGYTELEDKHNKFRKLIKNHFSHRSNTGATRDGLMACELWGGLKSEEMIKRINELKAHDIKFEDVWIDAGWYGQCTKCDDAFSGDWGEHTGEWEVNKRVHPNDLIDVRDAAKNAGMNLMLWFEPERAIKGTPITKEHPDWFLKLPNCKSLILNYGNSEAVDYVYNLLSHYVSELELSCYRQDFNSELTSYFKANDEENRCGISEIKHITGMYHLWDRLLQKYPYLIIDNCSSGGRRIDIETLKRSIPFFRSDYQCNFNEDPEVLQVHNANISCYLPYNGCTSKTKNDTYAIRSSYSSSWGGAFYNAIFQSMNEEDFKWAKQITDEYRKIRKYFSMDFYNHGSNVFDSTAWAIWQYHDNEAQSGIVMAFRRKNSPFDNVEIQLKSTVENQEYLFHDLNTGNTFIGSNAIKIHLPQKQSSVIMEYKLK
ncbi:MAG: alpha-galactosidase [Oscillospiraceae bacterium]|nr:alpha-galactosidase [Oscillospiraceae bacterium]